jgi:hypothetical protein
MRSLLIVVGLVRRPDARSVGAEHQPPVSKQSDPIRQVIHAAVLGNFSAGLSAFGFHDN